MPNIVTGNTTQAYDLSSQGKISYVYPGNKDYSPGSALSQKLITHVMQLARESAATMSNRHPYWNEIDDTLNCYIRLDDSEKKSQANDDRKPVSIVFPHSYALLETTLSYLCSVFFKDPIFHYKGSDASSIIGAQLMELVIQQQIERSKVTLSLHTLFRDSLAYGVGVAVPTWKKRVGKVYKKVKRGFFFEKEYLELQEDVVFEGNELKNVDPYKYLPDVSQPALDIQSGEYFGWVDSALIHDLQTLEAQSQVFNIKYLEKMAVRTSSLITKNSYLRNRINRGSTDSNNSRNQRCDTISMYVKIIPKKFGLGDSDIPEKWFFTIAADSILIEARPAGLNHDLFPAVIAAPDFDGYSPTPLSRIETMMGPQKLLDFFLNSRVSGVRKTHHDMFIVDPYLVNVNDIANPEAGRLIRLRKPAWGKGVQNAIQQLPVLDVTQNHVNDAGFIMSLMSKISGVDDASMGVLRQGGPERLSSAEYQGTKDGAISRLDRIARIISMQSMQDLGFFFANHTQQFMEKSTYVKFYGQSEQEMISAHGGQPGTFVSPLDLAINYQCSITDNSKSSTFLPNWMELFQYITKDPVLAQTFDVGRVFRHLAQMMGANDIGSFIKAQQMPDQQVQQQAQAGNMIPATPQNIADLSGALAQ